MSDPRHHLAFPFRIGADGRAASPPSREQHVEEELIQLLLTDLGERLFLPELGTQLRRLVFQGADPATAGTAKATIMQALTRWMDERAQIDEVDVQAAGETIEVMIRYRVAGGPPRVLRLRRGPA
ncbi:MAG TPA: GPW/gp25 family protein [Kofleriaceae bacterium]|nr:GPW/gp25 family protein [Kofleriaceae bacterium]